VTLKRQVKQILSTNNGIAFKYKLLKTTLKKLHKSPFRNVVKSTLAMERLKPATELKLVSVYWYIDIECMPERY